MISEESRQERNELGQPVGRPVEAWRGGVPPNTDSLRGSRVRIEALSSAHHGEALHAEFSVDDDETHWTYLHYGPFESAAAYCDWIDELVASNDVLAFAILDVQTGDPIGVACYLRLDPANGSIEVGHLRFSSRLQRTTHSTEAMALMMRRVFEDWGYRRYEWKCNALNAPSRAAAERLGFRYEGTFMNAQVAKGRNRDTAWFSILDSEWPALRDAFESWLSPENLDAHGAQKRPLKAFQPDSAGRTR